MTDESILDHGYIAEEHAPDPVISHGDPLPPGKVAIWLFLASEIMFFIGILGTYIVLRSGSPALFSRHAEALNKLLAGINTLVLLFSSMTMYVAVDSAHHGRRGRTIAALAITIACACTFMGIKYVEYKTKFDHHTVVARESANGPVYVYDGHLHQQGEERTLTGYRAEITSIPGFNINLVSEHDVKHASGQKEEREFTIPSSIAQDINYGPWKNNFFGSYFATTAVHGVHVLGGIVALSMLLVLAIRGRVLPAHTEYVGLYWHFVDLVWIFLFPLLYLI